MKRQPPSPGRKSLSRQDIVKKMQEDLRDLVLTNKVVTQVLNAFINVYKESILEAERVEIRNFGVMNSRLMRGMPINHPETKEELLASPYYKIGFKPSRSFRALLLEKAKKEVQKL